MRFFALILFYCIASCLFVCLEGNSNKKIPSEVSFYEKASLAGHIQEAILETTFVKNFEFRLQAQVLKKEGYRLDISSLSFSCIGQASMQFVLSIFQKLFLFPFHVFF
ncbi:hypothetical protein [Pedobacter glucosidilyticus]|uniref:hypothetical protein n=1 Tax=Pedobacter glucosidilyticus TaxID=1122941 RepID=UPI000406E972|nr:hypothetical protein [Pedobacter glucosidilyticus]